MEMETKTSTTIKRPPIVVVMGHVDHGKTTLLDYIRKTKTAEMESGGITQHIGAYEVSVGKRADDVITFLDTPGHEAFFRMRARGAGVADIAVLVVAADDGVKPQTLEALKVIRASEIPFIVALNKTDKPDTNADRVKKELSEHDVLIEEWGGKVPLVPISALKGEGVEQLLEMILLVAELEELKADPNLPASGIVIESLLDAKRGNTATLLIRDGTLALGDIVVAGNAVVRTRILENDLGKPITRAQFSSPVRVIGFDRLPPIGATFQAAESKKAAKALMAAFDASLGVQIQEPGIAETTAMVILKADVVGSLEALEDEVKKFSGKDITIQVLRSAVGDITEDDLQLAARKKNVFVIGFRVRFAPKVKELFEQSAVSVKMFDVIYDIRSWLKEALEHILPHDIEEHELGSAKVLKIFKTDKTSIIVGGRVDSGKLARHAFVKIERIGKIIGEGKIDELQHNKINEREVESGNEFGARLLTKIRIIAGDKLIALERKIIRRQLETIL